MKLTVVSHAGLLVEHVGRQLLCDPWIVGSCYWRSWWNYPPVKPDLIERLKPDWIYLTHIHWDHFHSASLKLFPSDTRILLPYDRYSRMRDDLYDLGYRNVAELRHGRRCDLGEGLFVTSYQFAPCTDSALVVEGDGVTIFNANDAKFMGGPLDQILRAHPRIDFALRSHSSANPRLSYVTYGESAGYEDDQEVYLRSFCAFMRRVRPRYAIPFASNHCHLHRETEHFNAMVQTPLRVKEYFAAFKAERPFDSELVVMTSGDSWDSGTGFDVRPSPWLENRQAMLAAYREEKRAALERTYAREAKITVSADFARRHLEPIAAAIPWPIRRKFRNRPVLFEVVAGERKRFFRFDVYARTVDEVSADAVAPQAMRIVIPAVIFKQSLAQNMFGHAGISKRVRYCATATDMPLLRTFEGMLYFYEFEAIPLRKLLRRRTLVSYLDRWREVVLYGRLFAGLMRGIGLRAQEERLLG
jgi:UDP-MurNAc hydroxylase